MEDARETRRRIAVALHSPLPSSSAGAFSFASSSHSALHATSVGALGLSGADVTTTAGGSPKSLTNGTTGSPKSLTSGTKNPFFVDDPFEHISQPPVSAPAGYSPGGGGFSRFRKDRTTRRSADVLLHVRAIDDGAQRTDRTALHRGWTEADPIPRYYPTIEHRAQRQQGLPGPGFGIRETTRADIVTDEIGALAGVNEYAVIKELGRGAFAEVKLCRKQPPSSPSAATGSISTEPSMPFSSSSGNGGSGASSPVPLSSSSPTAGAGETAGVIPISRGGSSSGSIREGEELYVRAYVWCV